MTLLRKGICAAAEKRRRKGRNRTHRAVLPFSEKSSSMYDILAVLFVYQVVCLSLLICFEAMQVEKCSIHLFIYAYGIERMAGPIHR